MVEQQHSKQQHSEHQHYNFGAFETSVHILPEIPDIGDIAADFGGGFFSPLLVCDGNTRALAEKIRGNTQAPICALESGEQHKNWREVETILRCARDNGIGRDGTFIGVGGGVIGDTCAFAASVYMRGCSLALVSTTLLAMADASVGGKTGFDLFGIKNLVGTFYPARHVYMPMESLASLPPPEWKSGMAEVIKTAALAGGTDNDGFFDEVAAIAASFPKGSFDRGFPAGFASKLLGADSAAITDCVSRAVKFKGGIVEEDPRETGSRRILLNLGHTFGHALEAAAGLGTISHGEAVAWGIARSCDLGQALGVCPPSRAEKIRALLDAYGYETGAPHPLADSGIIMRAFGSDKKKRGGNLTFIVPGEKGAVPVVLDSSSKINNIINGETFL